MADTSTNDLIQMYGVTFCGKYLRLWCYRCAEIDEHWGVECWGWSEVVSIFDMLSVARNHEYEEHS